ncbi:hypothetical protein SNE40_005695 [Patella caerulea]|uniref:Large ribosomal subunit protein mL62 n=1 Tax=Patella caerulea TaxID=87958 RepID=A0AAN8PXR4_PATCE
MFRLPRTLIIAGTKRIFSNNHTKTFKQLALGYKSQYNVDNIYTKSNTDFLSDLSKHITKFSSANNEEFSGYIPTDQLTISYSRSSGPGGQHVNKVNTKVEIRFHVESAEWIPQWVRDKLVQKEQNNINKEGFLIITSDRSRKQMLNQADCLDKLRTMIFNSCQKPYEPTEEEIRIKNKRIAKAQREILRKKREHSLKKQNRSSPSFGDS